MGGVETKVGPTPGPWKIVAKRVIMSGDGKMGPGRMICEVLDTSEGYEGCDPVADANARLLVNTPALLYELTNGATINGEKDISFADVLDDIATGLEANCRYLDSVWGDWLNEKARSIREAVAKATGEVAQG